MKKALAGFACLLLLALAVFLMREPGTSSKVARVESAPVQESEDAPAVELSREEAPDRVEALVDTTEREATPIDPSGGVGAPGGIELLVTDRADVPIEGARVRASEGGTTHEGSTGVDGRLALPIEPGEGPGAGSIRIEIDAPGFFHARANYMRLAELHVRLSRTVELRGHVLDAETGSVLPGAAITHVHAYCKGCEPDKVIARLDGSYELKGIPAEFDARFFVEVEGYAVGFFRYELPADPAIIEHDFQLERGIAVAGRVVEVESHVSIAGARIFDDHGGETFTDATGAFEHTGHLRDDGELKLRVEAEGYCVLWCYWEAKDLAEPPLLELVPSVPVEGRVFDETGAPVADVVVSVRDDHRANALDDREEHPLLRRYPSDWRAENEDAFPSSKTDGEGHFLTSGVVPWQHYTLMVRHDGYRRFSESFDTLDAVPGQPVWKEVRLEKASGGGRLFGDVALNGEPTAGYVSWSGASRSGGTTIEAGAYRLEDVEPGTVKLNVYLEDDGFNHAVEGREARVLVGAGDEIRHDFELSVALAPITGRILSADGEGASGQHLIAMSDPGRMRFDTRAGDDGRFEVDVPSSEEAFDLIVWFAREPIEVAGVAPGTENVEIVLPPIGTLRFQARDEATDKLVPGYDVWWRRPPDQSFDAGGVTRWTTPGHDDWYEIEIGAGTLDLMFRADELGYLPKIVEGIVVDADSKTAVEGRLERGLEVLFRLEPDTEPPPKDHTVLFLEAHAWGQVRYWNDSGGNHWDGGDSYPGLTVFERSVRFDGAEARLKGLTPGTYRFKVVPDDIAIEPETVELPLATDAVELRWSRRD